MPINLEDLGDEATGSVPVGDITGNSYTFTGATMPADGTTIIVSASFSDDPTCALTNSNGGTAPEACSVIPCAISAIDVTNISACDDQTTADGGDDTNGDINPNAEEICDGETDEDDVCVTCID